MMDQNNSQNPPAENHKDNQVDNPDQNNPQNKDTEQIQEEINKYVSSLGKNNTQQTESKTNQDQQSRPVNKQQETGTKPPKEKPQAASNPPSPPSPPKETKASPEKEIQTPNKKTKPQKTKNENDEQALNKKEHTSQSKAQVPQELKTPQSAKEKNETKKNSLNNQAEKPKVPKEENKGDQSNEEDKPTMQTAPKKQKKGKSFLKNPLVIAGFIITVLIILIGIIVFLRKSGQPTSQSTKKEEAVTEHKKQQKQTAEVKPQKPGSAISKYYPDSIIKSKQQKTPIQMPMELTDFETPAGNEAFVVGSQTISQEDFTLILQYYQKEWHADISSQEFLVSLKEDLIERLILEEFAESNNYIITEQDLKQTEDSLFNSKKPSEFLNMAETKAMIRTKAIKQKVIKNEISWVSAFSLVVQTGGPRAVITASERNTSPEKLAQQAINPYHQKAKQGVSTNNLINELNNDELILALARYPEVHTFKYFTKDQISDLKPWFDPYFYELLFTLQKGETSKLFIMKHPQDYEENKWVEYGYTFIRIDDKQTTDYDSYQNWLNEQLEKYEVKVGV
jgi:hypothetical protein